MLEISKAIFAAPVTRVVLTTPTSAGGNAAVLAALKAPVTARDDRLTAVKADFKELPAFGPPGTITSTSPILGLRAERIEFANGVTALVSNNKVATRKVRVHVRFGTCTSSVDAPAPNLLWTGPYAPLARGTCYWDQHDTEH